MCPFQDVEAAHLDHRQSSHLQPYLLASGRFVQRKLRYISYFIIQFQAPQEVLRAFNLAAALETRLPLSDRIAHFRRRPPQQFFQKNESKPLPTREPILVF